MKDSLASDDKVRQEFCVQAAIALRSLALETGAEAPTELWKALLEACQKMDWEEPRLSLPLAQAVPPVLAMTEAPDLIAAITSKVFAEAPTPWLEAVADAAAKKRKQKDTPETAKTALASFLRACATSRPESLPLLRLARDN